MGLMYSTKENVIKLELKSGQTIYTVLLNSDDYKRIEGKKMAIIKQHGHATVNIFLEEGYKKKKSLGKFILETDKNVYLKNRLISDSNILDYRKENLTLSIKDMVGYTDIAREHFYKNKDKIMSARHKKGVYQSSIAEKIIKNKSGEKSYRAKLTNNDVINIRERYVSGLITQEKLAKEYGVSRSTISSIVTYKRWKDFHLRPLSNLNKKNVILLDKKSESKKHLSFFDFNDDNLFYLKDDNLVYYLEKINDNGLVYLEVRNKKNDVLVRSDLLFSDYLNSQTNREYSIACKYPVKTPIKDLVSYVDKLKMYI